MKKLSLLLILLSCGLSSLMVFANDPIPTYSSNTVTSKQIQLIRGQSMTLDELSSIAKVSTARDEQGNAVSLENKSYTIESYTRGTVSVIPSNGQEEDLITLDLSNQ